MTDAPPPYPGINGFNGYAAAPQQPNGGHTMTSAEAKAAEANAPPPPMPAAAPQNGWYDPNNPHTAYVPAPPPGAGELPPSYDASTKKND